ncbi:hypothetical protein FQZ97_743530 [compost metagenome]
MPGCLVQDFVGGLLGRSVADDVGRYQRRNLFGRVAGFLEGSGLAGCALVFQRAQWVANQGVARAVGGSVDFLEQLVAHCFQVLLLQLLVEEPAVACPAVVRAGARALGEPCGERAELVVLHGFSILRAVEGAAKVWHALPSRIGTDHSLAFAGIRWCVQVGVGRYQPVFVVHRVRVGFARAEVFTGDGVGVVDDRGIEHGGPQYLMQ